MKPKAFVADSTGEAYLCQCKASKNQPFCDGSHKSFQKEDIGNEVPEPKVTEAKLPMVSNTAEEPTLEYIHALARDGLREGGAPRTDDLDGGPSS